MAKHDMNNLNIQTVTASDLLDDMRGCCVVIFTVGICSSTNVTNTDEQSTKALIPQTDHKTCCVSQNLVNCCTTVQTSWTANPQQPEVIEFEYYHRWMRNKLCASSNDVSTIVGVICKLNCRQVLLIDLAWQNYLSPEFGPKFQREAPLFLEVPEGQVQGSSHAKN